METNADVKTTMRLEQRTIADLLPYAQNARVHSEEQLAELRRSIQEYGFVAPVLVDAAGNVIAGHGRLLAAAALGMSVVPCVPVEHLTDAQVAGYRLADNRLAEAASWDYDLLSAELSALRDIGFDVQLTGFDESFILSDPEPVTEDDYDEPLPAEPKTCRGEIYQLGRHRLMCGDAADPADVAALMDGERAQMLLTDPPYNVAYVGKTEDRLVMEGDDYVDGEAFLAMLEGSLRLAAGALDPGGAFYIWHPDGSPALAFRTACERVGLHVRQCLVWVKQSATLGRQDYQWRHEPCLTGTRCEAAEEDAEGKTHDACLYGWRVGDSHSWHGGRRQSTVLEFDRPMRSAEHPTMKPVLLFAHLIQNSTCPGDIITDFYGGSGTTLVACEQLERTAYLMDIDPRYVDVTIDRWERLTGQKAVKLTR